MLSLPANGAARCKGRRPVLGLLARCSVKRIDNGGAPGGGVGVASVACDDPVVAFVIEHGELKFAVLGFVRLLEDLCAAGFRALKVTLNIFHKNREALRAEAELPGSLFI